MKIILLLVAAATVCAGEQPRRFDSFKVYRVVPTTELHLTELHELEKDDNYNFWSPIALHHTVDVMVPPHIKYDFEHLIHSLQLSGKVLIENVQNLVENEQNRTASRGELFTSYQTLDEIHDWLRGLARTYPDFVKLVVGGRSYEGREILGVHVSFKSGNKGVFLEGGIHAREWISPATVSFILHQLLTSTDPAIRAVAESRDWYVFPVVNPDGYVYTHTTNRVWRKTRNPYQYNGQTCYGADPNRNWGYHWNEGGTVDVPCYDIYSGEGPFSLIETKSLSDYINTIASNLDSYLAFHSYSQLLLIPFGHSGLEVPENNDELHEIGKNALAKLYSRYGTSYNMGNIPEAIYVASGGSTDWVAGVHRNVRLVYTFELRDEGMYGFLLPANQIIPTGQETLDAVVSMIQQISD
ncbi:zinc carboxypeptidase-like [Photinus pyralis]|nr:zinc carboxypeptidase-like [Photinus pyralis]